MKLINNQKIDKNDWRFRRDLEKAKFQVWLRDKGLCAKCGEIPERHETDHIIPISQGGEPFELTNLQTLCYPCHLEKTTDERKRGYYTRGKSASRTILFCRLVKG